MAFWDTYLVYNDDDFAEYLYEFPKFVADKQLESHYGYENPDIWNVTDDSHQSASQNVTASADVNDNYGDYYGGYGMEEIQDILDQLYEAYGRDDAAVPVNGKRQDKAKGKRVGK